MRLYNARCCVNNAADAPEAIDLQPIVPPAGLGQELHTSILCILLHQLPQSGLRPGRGGCARDAWLRVARCGRLTSASI